MKLALALVAVALLVERPAAEPVAQIPFTMTGYHAFVEVELNDRTLSFVFDSGGGGVGLNRASARRLGLEATGSGPVTGAGGAIQVPLVSGLALRVGQLRLAGVIAALVELGHLEEVVGRPVDGIIGRDVLDGRLVVLDNDRQVLEVHEERSFPFEQWGEPCALKRSGPLEVPGQIRLLSGEILAGLFHVDSGAASFLNLNSVFVDTHGLAERAGDLYPRKGRGLTGVTITDQVGAVASVEFCGYEFPSTEARRFHATVPVLLSGATAGVLGRSGPAGLIGNAILSRFNLVFDLERDRMFLKPVPGVVGKPRVEHLLDLGVVA